MGPGRADHPSAFDEQSLFDGEDLGPDHPGRDRPPRQADHQDEPEEVDGPDASGNHDHQDEPRNRQDDVVEAHHHLVDPASDGTGDEPNGCPKSASSWGSSRPWPPAYLKQTL